MFSRIDEDSTMQCPKCQSQNVFLCSVACEQGTITTTTRGSATSSVDQTTMHIDTTSTSRTAFAQRCAPPTSTLRWAILATLVMLSANVAMQVHLHVKGMFAGNGTHAMLGVLAICVLWLILAIRNRPRYRESLERWRRTWACASCGNFFRFEQ
jgi:hypothetical protein